MFIERLGTRLPQKSSGSQVEPIAFVSQRKGTQVNVLELLLVFSPVDQSQLDRVRKSEFLNRRQRATVHRELTASQVDRPIRILHVFRLAKLVPVLPAPHAGNTMHRRMRRGVVRGKRWVVQVIGIEKPTALVRRDVTVRERPAIVGRLLADDRVGLLISCLPILGAIAPE